VRTRSMPRLTALLVASATALSLMAPQSLADGSDKRPARPTPAPPASSERPCGDWGMYGGGLARTFSRERCWSPIDRSSVRTLVPAWVSKTTRTVTASPVVAGGVVFVGAWDGVMRAYDAQTGTEKWAYTTAAAGGAAFGPIVSSAAVADVGGTRLVIFGAGPVLYALNAVTGQPVWTRAYNRGLPIDTTPVEIEASPVVWNDTVYVGVSTHNEPASRTDGENGALVALDAATGADKWRFEPDPAGNGCGGIWGSPAIDVERSRVVFGTANCTDAAKWTQFTEAVISLDAATGALAWSYQPSTPNVRDEDFGATPNLYTNANHVDVVGIGKKDGFYYQVRADTGTLLAKTQVAEPGNVRDNFAVGGFIGSTAVMEGNVFGGTAVGGPPFFHSIDGTSGNLRWQSASGPVYAASAGVNGVVFNAALDSTLKAFDAQTGAVLWSAPLLGPSSSGAAVVGNMVFVGAGTSSSDACAKDTPLGPPCEAVFDAGLGSTGGVHAFRLALPSDTPNGGDGESTLVFNGENNRLNAYDAATGAKQTVIPSWADAPGTGKDINAQICFFPDGSGRFIAGEDTFQDRTNPATGQNESMGWGIFQLAGKKIGELSATQVGKLTPTFQPSEDNPENYGCGFLGDGRVVTTDVGDQQPQANANGQLIVWFPPFDSYTVRYCKVDVAIGTANQIHVAADDTVYVASARPDKAGNLGAIYAYRNLPTSDTPAGGCGAQDGTGAPLATPGSYTKTTFINDQANVPTPNAMVPSGRGTYYVSSVFTGVIAEYSATGTFIRRILSPAPGDVLPPYATGTPFGLGVGPDGTIYYADIGVVLGPPPGPGDHNGSVRRIRFDGTTPQAPERMDENLQYPDGIGVLVVSADGTTCPGKPGQGHGNGSGHCKRAG
jgi:outer membrane protein assembly factor BamB